MPPACKSIRDDQGSWRTMESSVREHSEATSPAGSGLSACGSCTRGIGGIRYCVVGGQAVNAYAEPLVSLDLDLVIAVDQLQQAEGPLAAPFHIERHPHRRIPPVAPASASRTWRTSRGSSRSPRISAPSSRQRSSQSSSDGADRRPPGYVAIPVGADRPLRLFLVFMTADPPLHPTSQCRHAARKATKVATGPHSTPLRQAAASDPAPEPSVLLPPSSPT